MSKEEAPGDNAAVFKSWNECVNCKQQLRGALALEMHRRFWRRYRSSQNPILHYHSMRYLATCLELNGEKPTANYLYDEASKLAGGDKTGLLDVNLDVKICRASTLLQNDQTLEAVELLQTVLPELKEDRTANPGPYVKASGMMTIMLDLIGRHQEARITGAEAVAFAKATMGPEHSMTLLAMTHYAKSCASLGRVEESREVLTEVLTVQTRVLGRDHPETQHTRNYMTLLFPVPPPG